jgi:spore coat assembly protein
MGICAGDTVILKPNPKNHLWKVLEINLSTPGYVKIKGLTNRLIKVTPEDQLEKVNEITAKKILEENKIKNKIHLESISKKIPLEQPCMSNGDRVLSKIPGIVLHLDGDKRFLNGCLDYYKKNAVPAYGYTMKPDEMPSRILELLNTHNPNILIITGHDGCTNKKDLFSLESYIYSKYYIESVKQARKFDRNKDNLVIFAGACESFYEALMESGANFASSPKRIPIHAYDPAVIAVEVALTPILSRVDPSEVILKAKSSFDAIGGIDTRGTLRNGISFNMRSSIYERNFCEYNSYFSPCAACAYRYYCSCHRNIYFSDAYNSIYALLHYR